MFTLPIKWTSIGSLGWFALPPRTSLMKCEASYLRRGWVERNSFPSWPNSESFIWPTELHILFHYGAMNILEFFFLEIRPLSSWAWRFVTKIMLILDISVVFCAKSLRVLRSSEGWLYLVFLIIIYMQGSLLYLCTNLAVWTMINP